mmetsp:Transcript_31265/g.96804  ORF Transcript_31265/g.96804 Transcript_31265/m.96804 type:complete len:381 (-) Transcript_31265:7-1149(-)
MAQESASVRALRLTSSVVARFLGSTDALRFYRSRKDLRRDAKDARNKWRLWTFDIISRRQCNVLYSRVDPAAVRVVRRCFGNGVFENGMVTYEFPKVRSLAIVRQPRRSKRDVAIWLNVQMGLVVKPRGNQLTARHGVAAAFAMYGSRSYASLAVCFRLRVDAVSRTFTHWYGGEIFHGSSNFCDFAIPDSDSDNSNDSNDSDDSDDDAFFDARVDFLRDLPQDVFRVDAGVDADGRDFVEWVVDRSLADEFSGRDAIVAPEACFGDLELVLFPWGRSGTRDRAAFFLKLAKYDDHSIRTRAFDVRVDGARAGSIVNGFSVDNDFAGLLDVGASAALFPRRETPPLVIRVTRLPADAPRHDGPPTVVEAIHAAQGDWGGT